MCIESRDKPQASQVAQLQDAVAFLTQRTLNAPAILSCRVYGSLHPGGPQHRAVESVQLPV